MSTVVLTVTATIWWSVTTPIARAQRSLVARLEVRGRRPGRSARLVAAAVGALLLVAAMAVIEDATPYQGTAALLPTAATVALLVAGAGTDRPSTPRRRAATGPPLSVWAERRDRPGLLLLRWGCSPHADAELAPGGRIRPDCPPVQASRGEQHGRIADVRFLLRGDAPVALDVPVCVSASGPDDCGGTVGGACTAVIDDVVVEHVDGGA